MLKKICFAGLVLAVCFQFTGSAYAAPDTAKLLQSRSMTEEEYLKQVPKIFYDLYGPMAVPAAKRIWENSGPVFAVDAIARAYGEIWALDGPLNVNERSLATVAALVALNLYPEIKLHINGFISSGGTLEQLYALAGIAAREAGARDLPRLAEAVADGLQWRAKIVAGFTAPSRKDVTTIFNNKPAALDPRMTLLTNLSAQIALGKMEKTKTYMDGLVKGLPLDVDKDRYIDLLITHLIVYCGYPRGMNAFHVWQQLRPAYGMK
jgi:alkylhydroperoxidase/carboxymuconolactone decarboxylase family protein YurZ